MLPERVVLRRVQVRAEEIAQRARRLVQFNQWWVQIMARLQHVELLYSNGLCVGRRFVLDRLCVFIRATTQFYALHSSEQKFGQERDLAGGVRKRSENGRGRPRQSVEGRAR